MTLRKMALLWAGLAAVATGCNCDLVVAIPTEDAGEVFDAGELDAGAPDAGDPDGGVVTTDSGFVDAGYVDAGCPGPTIACYSGSTGTLNKGVCRAGTQSCSDTKGLGPCAGEIIPSVESCNGLDDDCNDTVDDPAVLGQVACGQGACQIRTSACATGRPAACVPDSGSGGAAIEICNNSIDEDCDGVLNNGCNCIYVAPGPFGSDVAGTGSSSAPFASIQVAIATAANVTGRQVCVGSLPGCSAATPLVATYAEAVVMFDGVSVFGGYRPVIDGGAWPRPGSQNVLQPTGNSVRKGCATAITAVDERGVYFGHNVRTATSIDGFQINGGVFPNAGPNGTAAVTVEGSAGAVINDNVIVGGVVNSVTTTPALFTVGIFVDGRDAGTTPTISNNAIIGGSGLTAIGVRSVSGAPKIQDSCNLFDSAGRCLDMGCESSCFTSIPGRKFIRARPSLGNCTTPSVQTNAVDSYAIRLESSPNTVISRSAICTSSVPGESAGVRISGNSTAVVIRANRITAEGAPTNAKNSVGVWADGCVGTSPWIVNNAAISGTGRTPGSRGDGIRAVGKCPIRVDSNQAIIGGLEAAGHEAYGVYCARDPATASASRCTITNNVDIVGGAQGFPPVSAGIRCDDGACARIEGNQRISARGGNYAYGIILGDTGTYVARNMIEAGCAQQLSAGVLSNNSYARLENNVIGGSRWTGSSGTPGSFCPPGSAAPPNVFGVLAVVAAGNNEVDLNSNDIFALGTNSQCTARALAFDIQSPCTAINCLDGGMLSPPKPPTAPRGVIRNNILHSGYGTSAIQGCMTSYVVHEMNAAAEPRIFENNALCSSGNNTLALYLDEGMFPRTTPAQVNGMTDIASASNLSAPPNFAFTFNFAMAPLTNPGVVPPVDVKLEPISPLVDAGTAVGGPTNDFYGGPRPVGSPDIGAHEQ